MALLTGLMADPERLDSYIAALKGEQERRGVRLTLLQRDGADLPDERIAAEGFGGLADAQLADIALSPEALRALKDSLDDPETAPGPWLIEAVRHLHDEGQLTTEDVPSLAGSLVRRAVAQDRAMPAEPAVVVAATPRLCPAPSV